MEEDLLRQCENKYDSEEAVATCVAGLQNDKQLINVWDKETAIIKELKSIRMNQEEEMRTDNVETLRKIRKGEWD